MWKVLELELSKIERGEGAGLGMETCASLGVHRWLRATSAKLLLDLNENAEIIGPSTAERNGSIS